jgi:hypothetical protein
MQRKSPCALLCTYKTQECKFVDTVVHILDSQMHATRANLITQESEIITMLLGLISLSLKYIITQESETRRSTSPKHVRMSIG